MHIFVTNVTIVKNIAPYFANEFYYTNHYVPEHR